MENSHTPEDIRLARVLYDALEQLDPDAFLGEFDESDVARRCKVTVDGKFDLAEVARILRIEVQAALDPDRAS